MKRVREKYGGENRGRGVEKGKKREGKSGK